VRGIGVAVSNFTLGTEQLSIDTDIIKDEKKDRLELAVDGIRKKYGNHSLQRARILQDPRLAETDIIVGHTVNPRTQVDGSDEI